MNRRPAFHELAERELNEAAAYYRAEAGPQLASAFLDEVERVVALVALKPEAGRTLLGAVHAWPLRRFPYSVLYETGADVVVILAVANQKRRPLYWLDRAK
jgi:toxin ParE1/3/4